MTSPRIGPQMRALHDVVSALPGCSKRAALAAAGLPLSGPGRDAPLNRAVAAGLVVIERERVNRHRCFANERDRQRWHLRRELLQPGCLAARVAEIWAQIRALDAERGIVSLEES